MIADRVGTIKIKEGKSISPKGSLLTEASVCYDAVYTPAGDSLDMLAANADYYQFIEEAYRHCTALSFAAGAEMLLKNIRIKPDQGVILVSEGKNDDDFISVMKQHRVWERETSRKIPA